MSKFREFDESVETFEAWEERLQQYFFVNYIDDEFKVAHLITLLGAKTYAILKTELFRTSQTSKSYDDLVKVLKSKFTLTVSIIVERFKFHNRKQAVGENVKQYIAAIKEMSKFCKFEASLDEHLRDHLVCGVSSTVIQQKLLSEADTITFAEAYKISENQSKMIQEMATMAIGNIQHQKSQYDNSSQSGTKSKRSMATVHEEEPDRTQNKRVQRCYRCSRFHDPQYCRARFWECFKCHQKGHTSLVCKKENVPVPEDIFSNLSGHKYFTVIDLKGAYQQLDISEKSKETLTIITHMGLYGYNR